MFSRRAYPSTAAPAVPEVLTGAAGLTASCHRQAEPGLALAVAPAGSQVSPMEAEPATAALAPGSEGRGEQRMARRLSCRLLGGRVVVGLERTLVGLAPVEGEALEQF